MYLFRGYVLSFCIILLNCFGQAQQNSDMGSAGGWAVWPQGQQAGIMGQATPTGTGLAGSSNFLLAPGLVTTYSVSPVQLDIMAPEISHTPVQTAPMGSDIPIGASAEDDGSGVDRFLLFYRRTGDISRIDSTFFAGDVATIPGSMHTQRGVEYALKAVDGAGNIALRPESGYFQIQAEISDNEGVPRDASGNPISQHGGNKITDYRIFSVPIELQNKTPAHVFEDELEAPNPERWRLWDVDNGNLRAYSAIRNSQVVRPGKGFLLIIRDANIIIDTGGGVTPKIAQYRRIPLQPGWNLVGNPFDFDIPMDKVRIKGQQPEAWEYGSSGWRNTPSSFRRWSGLAVYAQQGDTLEIDVSSGVQGKVDFTDKFDGDNWGMQVLLKGEETRDVDNYLGVYREREPLIRTEWHEPPVLSGAAALKIVVQEDDITKNLSTQLQKAGETGNYWDLEISGQAGDVNGVAFKLYGEVPETHLQYVIDRDLKMAYDITKLPEALEVRISGQGGARKLRFLAGDRSFIKNNSAGVDVFPDAYTLRQNFPNPFNPTTNIVFMLPQAAKVQLDIYNILGQRVRNLLNDNLREEGYHMVEWNGKNDFGIQVASGLYFIRFKAAGHQMVKKAIFAK
jgi:hypothetical protein